MQAANRTRVRMLAAAAIAACGVPVLASPLPPPSLAGRLDLMLEKQDAAAPGLSIVIIEDGSVLYQRSKGMADLVRKTPITEDTVFALGALTEVINVIALAQLVESGRLAPAQRIGEVLPGLAETLAAIKVSDLLSPETSTRMPVADRQRVVPQLIARACGRSYPQCLAERIFGPAAMAGSYVSGTRVPRPRDEALGFGREQDRAAFDVHSSAADLGRLMQAFSSGTLVRQPFDLSYANVGKGFRHLVRGNAARSLYTVVLANSGAAADALIAEVTETVAVLYEQPMPQM